MMITINDDSADELTRTSLERHEQDVRSKFSFVERKKNANRMHEN